MRRCLSRLIAAVAVTGGLTLTGCSTGGDDGPTPSPTQTSPQATASTTTTAARTAAPGEVGTSPDGVTTAVGAPAESTEEEYFQACNAARTWMAERGGDLNAQVEPYLAEIQKSDAPGPGTFGTPWSQLEPARQAAIIVAVEAAADELCG
ncbi:lipoprotein LpqV [Mycolicibacterium litorale]|uniref:LpqV protein n=1 Tax=Mycolicibacterium litorale TaxID=758802 RepID=A0AAD1MT08_9MYCO|nr:lipoprotein LpqV [Mycolicibacterium litorale]MCV7418644.1 lipoprotein LpqV [Mycolicibacterium litorale]TDY05958.1 hypothetical protein BCL50_2269 [Mycolicibacterium litorale]BBY14536.1 hypothetical protein MLIT_01280 [Mycolicibacterium litorale]